MCRAENVRFGSEADIGVGPRDVRFTPKSGHRLRALECPLYAKSTQDEISVMAITQGLPARRGHWGKLRGKVLKAR